VLAERGWLACYDHPIVGTMEAFGMLVDGFDMVLDLPEWRDALATWSAAPGYA
jgi:hypothetical protein